jgi:hypothetical protein
MTEKPPDNKVREKLVTNYETASELLEYKLYQVLKPLETQEQVAVHNDIMFDIQLMVGEGMVDLIEKVVADIILIGKAEVAKE